MKESEFMEAAWAGFITWAFDNPEMRAQFEAETGQKYAPPRSAIDAMIDDATGHVDDYVEAFAVWATRTHWGMDEAPEKMREAHATAIRADKGGEPDGGG